MGVVIDGAQVENDVLPVIPAVFSGTWGTSPPTDETQSLDAVCHRNSKTSRSGNPAEHLAVTLPRISSLSSDLAIISGSKSSIQAAIAHWVQHYIKTSTDEWTDKPMKPKTILLRKLCGAREISVAAANIMLNEESCPIDETNSLKMAGWIYRGLAPQSCIAHRDFGHLVDLEFS